jgi:hypothetical protein
MGFWLGKPESRAFNVTIFVHGNERSELLLRNVGSVWLQLGADMRRESIGEKGQAEFKNIPPSFLEKEVDCWVEAEGIAPKVSHIRLTPDGTFLAVSRLP